MNVGGREYEVIPHVLLFVVGFGVSSAASTWSPHVHISIILPSFVFFSSFSQSLSALCSFSLGLPLFLRICLCYCQCSSLLFGPLYRPINGTACSGQSGSDWLGGTTQSVFSLVTSVRTTYSSLPCRRCRA